MGRSTIVIKMNYDLSIRVLEEKALSIGEKIERAYKGNPIDSDRIEYLNSMKCDIERCSNILKSLRVIL